MSHTTLKIEKFAKGGHEKGKKLHFLLVMASSTGCEETSVKNKLKGDSGRKFCRGGYEADVGDRACGRPLTTTILLQGGDVTLEKPSNTRGQKQTRQGVKEFCEG